MTNILNLALRRGFSYSAIRAASYEDTVKNMRLTKDSRIICHGFTGKQVGSYFCNNINSVGVFV
jgi:hypothetical protein